MVDEPSLLEVEHLEKRYGPDTVVADLTFEVCRGEIVGLLGPNGSGKSTTLHCITDIIEPTSGAVLLDGVPHHDRAAKNVFGFLPDDLALPESLRIEEILTLHRRLRPDFDDELAQALIGLVGLDDQRHKYLAHYSHGMRRKLQLVTALAHHPRLLVLDEPMRGLDPEASILMSSLLDAFRSQGGGVLAATHDLLAAERYCDRVVVLAHGRAIADGPPKELVATAGVASLEQFFVRVTGLEPGMAAAQELVRRLPIVSRPTAALATARRGFSS